MLEKDFGIPKDKLLWAVIFIEHILILILVAIKALIPDISPHLREYIQRTKNEIKPFIEFSRSVVSKGDAAKLKQLEELLALQEKKSEKDRALEIIRYHDKDKSEIKIHQGRLVDFFAIDPR